MVISIAIFIYPLIYIVSASLSSAESLWAGPLCSTASWKKRGF